jgi:hypothetical protein
MRVLRTLLICHHDAPLDREGLARWLASFSTLTGSVVVREPHARLRKRIAREIRRVGLLRFVDVLAFQIYYRLFCNRRDTKWEIAALNRVRERFPEKPEAPELVVSSPNSPEAASFIRDRAPDLMIARCKTMLHQDVFGLAKLGTFVMHPGICPEYRNAHGCFWAAARGDFGNIGMTLLRIDKGVDTGPVYAYFRVTPDPTESHVVTQHRSVVDHLDDIRDKLLEISGGSASRIDTTGRPSATWGQPWLTALWNRRRAERRAARAASVTTTNGIPLGNRRP